MLSRLVTPPSSLSFDSIAELVGEDSSDGGGVSLVFWLSDLESAQPERQKKAKRSVVTFFLFRFLIEKNLKIAPFIVKKNIVKRHGEIVY